MVASSATTARASRPQVEQRLDPQHLQRPPHRAVAAADQVHAQPAPRRLPLQLHQRRDPRRRQERDAVEIDDDVGTLGKVLAHPPVEPGRGQGVEIAPDLHDGKRLGDVRGGDLQGRRLAALTEPRAGDDEAGLDHESGHPEGRNEWVTSSVWWVTIGRYAVHRTAGPLNAPE